MEETIFALREEIAQQSEAVSTFEEQSLVMAANMKQMTDDMDAMKSEFESKITQLTTANHNLQNDLRASYKHHKKEIAELGAEFHNQAYKDRYLAAMAENTNLRTRIERLAALFASMEQISALEQHANVATTIVTESLSNAIAVIHQHRESLTNERSQFEAEAGRFKESITACEGVRDLLDVNPDITQVSLAQALDSIKSLTNTDTLDDAMKAIQTMFTLSRDSERVIQSLQHDLGAEMDAQAALDEKIKELESDRDSKQAEINNMLGEQDAALSKLTEAGAEMQRLMDENDALTADKESLSNQITALKKTESELRALADEKLRQYNELKEFIEEERAIRQEVINDLEKDVQAAWAQAAAYQQVQRCELIPDHSLTL